MFGNKLGWGISVLIVALVAGVMYIIAGAGAVSQPTAQFLGNPTSLAVLALPAPPQSLLDMTDPADAAPYYRKAIDAYGSNPKAFDNFTRYTKLESAPPDILQLVTKTVEENLLPATRCASMRLFSAQPEEVVNYQPWDERQPLIALEKVGNDALHLGLLTGPKDADKAMKYIDAAFGLGAKLYQERVVYEEFSIGCELMSGGANQVASKSKDPARQQAARNFTGDYMAYVAGKGPVESKWHFISSIDDRIIEQRAGDVFLVANKSQERMWRVEAILKLGRYRFNAGTPGDQNGANRQAKIFAKDPDPAIRAAGEAAKNLTREQYLMLR